MMPNPRILITGSTGFLGGAVVADLIATEQWPDVLLLVRAANPVAGAERVAVNLRRFGLAESLVQTISPRQICCGDLTDLTNVLHDERLRRVTRVLNCAAITSFGTHPRIWQTNVDGTMNFVRHMARLTHLERFVQVGTAMICGDSPTRVVQEEDYPRAGVDHLVDYTESKARAEILLRAELPDQRLVIARPSIIAGHSTLGCRPSHSIFWTFRLSEAMRRITCPVDGVIDVVPVDWTAKALQTLLFKPTLAHGTYHVSAGVDAAVSFREIGAAFAAAQGKSQHEPYTTVTYQDLVDLQDRFHEFFGRCNRRFMLRAMKLYGAFAALDTRFANDRLRAEGVKPPPRFTDYLACCIDSCRHQALAEQMLTDFQ